MGPFFHPSMLVGAITTTIQAKLILLTGKKKRLCLADGRSDEKSGTVLGEWKSTA